MKAHIFISGFVQGVGFRNFVRRNAKRLELVGYVQNLPDGKVEAVFEGPDKKVGEMVNICRKGPFLSSVKNLELFEEDETGEFELFEVIH